MQPVSQFCVSFQVRIPWMYVVTWLLQRGLWGHITPYFSLLLFLFLIKFSLCQKWIVFRFSKWGIWILMFYKLWLTYQIQVWLLSFCNPFKPLIVYRMLCFGHHSTKTYSQEKKTKYGYAMELLHCLQWVCKCFKWKFGWFSRCTVPLTEVVFKAVVSTVNTSLDHLHWSYLFE